MTNTCFCSSFIFLTNSLFALSKKQYTYSLAFYTLAITSAVVHGICYTFGTMILDKIAILSVVILGAKYYISKYNDLSLTYSLCIIATFILVVLLYFYGYLANQFCYDKNKDFAYICHSILHLIGSIGHHMIIYSL
jgi:hypothetical protein